MKFVHTADTHLGFEITRINQSDPQGRRKRADHIFKNFLAVLDHTSEVEADLLIHSGDLFNKYYLPREILDELVQPIFELARSGTRILIIPGNHERSGFPLISSMAHPGFLFLTGPNPYLLTSTVIPSAWRGSPLSGKTPNEPF